MAECSLLQRLSALYECEPINEVEPGAVIAGQAYGCWGLLGSGWWGQRGVKPQDPG